MTDGERWRLDLDSHILFGPDVADGPEDGRLFWRTSYLHERSHWLRWQSSSVGLMLTLLRRARTITAVNALNSLDRRHLTRVVETAKTRPVWSFSTGYEPSLISEQFALSGQFWLDISFFEHLLLESADGAGDTWPPDLAVQPALADAWLAAKSFPQIHPHPGNQIAEHLFVELPIAAAETPFRPDPRLTTRVIWESACTLDELRIRVKQDDPDKDDHLRLVDAKLEEEGYGFALELAQAVTGGLSAKVFGVVSWLATDPQLPFFESEPTELHWSKFSPPYRFMRLCNAIRQRPIFRSLPSTGNIYEYAEEILSAASMTRATWPENPKPTVFETRGKKLNENTADFDSFPGTGQRFVGSLNAVAKASLGLRSVFAEVPGVFVHPIDEHVFSWSDGYPDATSEMFGNWRLLVPLVLDFEDGVFEGISEKIEARDQQTIGYLTSVMSRIVLEAFLENRDPRLSAIPRSSRRPDDSAPSSLRRKLGDRLLAEAIDIHLDW